MLNQNLFYLFIINDKQCRKQWRKKCELQMEETSHRDFLKFAAKKLFKKRAPAKVERKPK